MNAPLTNLALGIPALSPVTYAEDANCSVLAVNTSTEDGRSAMREIMEHIRNSPAQVAARAQMEANRIAGERAARCLSAAGGDKLKALALALGEVGVS